MMSLHVYSSSCESIGNVYYSLEKLKKYNPLPKPEVSLVVRLGDSMNSQLLRENPEKFSHVIWKSPPNQINVNPLLQAWWLDSDVNILLEKPYINIHSIFKWIPGLGEPQRTITFEREPLVMFDHWAMLVRTCHSLNISFQQSIQYPWMKGSKKNSQWIEEVFLGVKIKLTLRCESKAIFTFL